MSHEKEYLDMLFVNNLTLCSVFISIIIIIKLFLQFNNSDDIAYGRT